MLCPPCCATARLLRAEAFKYLDIIVLLQFTIGFLIAHRPGCKQWAEDVGNNTERYIRIGFITVSDEIRPTQEVDQQISQGNAAQLSLKGLSLSGGIKDSWPRTTERAFLRYQRTAKGSKDSMQ